MKINAVEFTIKRIILWLFVFSPVMAYSQYLEPGDIDILIKGWDTIDTAFGEADENAQAWENYNELGMAITVEFGGVMEAVAGYSDYDDEDGGAAGDGAVYLENLKLHFNEFLNCTVPENLEESFRSIGWKNNGHKKMFTIMFGSMVLIMKEELANEGESINTERFVNVSNIFNSSDLKIIQIRLEDIKHLLTS